MSGEGSEPGQASLDFVTVHYVMLATESYLRLYTAEGLRQGKRKPSYLATGLADDGYQSTP